MASTRDDFTQAIKQQLARRVGYHCSKPDCRKHTVGPSSDVKKFVNLGVAAHITAAAEGGKRYDHNLSSEERKSFNNGIWLCQNCAKLIDSDDEEYTVELIRTWKATAEQLASEELHSISSMQMRSDPQLSKIYSSPAGMNIVQNGWAPPHELFSSQANLMHSEYFIGRTQECSTLMACVSGNAKILISGMGGIGKTELARWIYQQCLCNHTFGHVGFLSYRGSMDAILLNALNPPDELPQEKQIAWAWNALHKLVQNEKVLLIVDDINKTVRQDPSLQRLLNLSCTVVLTSRRKTMAGCKSLPIHTLKLDDGTRLFENIYGPIAKHEKDNLVAIVQEIAYCHPLTIKILASIGKSKKIGLSELQFELETKKFTLAYIEDGEPIKLVEEYQKLFDLANLSIPEIRMLECFSILPYAQLPQKLYTTMMQEDAGNTCDMALNMLAQKNWLEESMGSFAMHPLIAEAIRFFRPFSAPEHPALLNGTTIMVAHLNHSMLFQEVVSYTDVVLAVANHYSDVNPAESIFLCIILSLKYYAAARYQLMCSLLEETLVIADRTQEEGLCDRVRYHLCLAYIKIGNYPAAYEEALLVIHYREIYCEKEAMEIGEAYHVLGGAQRCLGDFEAALVSYYAALEYYEAAEEEDNDVRLSNLYGDIGGIYLDLEQYENSLIFLQNDINMKEQMGTQDVELAIAYNNIADLYMQTERYDLAEQSLLKALELISQLWGEQSYHLETVYSNLANLYHILDQNEKALQYICRSIDIQIAEFEKHPSLSISYNSKAIILQSLGRIEEALQENDKAYTMLLDTIGEENITMARIELTYASAYSDFQNYAEVIPHAKKACKIFIKFYTNDHIPLIDARILLGEALSHTGDCQSALDILEQVEKRTESNLLFAQNFRSVLNLIRIYTELSQHENALQQCVKALKLCKHTGQTQETCSFIADKLLLCYQLSGRKEDKLSQWLKKTFKE